MSRKWDPKSGIGFLMLTTSSYSTFNMIPIQKHKKDFWRK